LNSVPKQRLLTITEAFLARFAGCLSDDFPDEIGDADLLNDSVRESLE
jgi:hypothetical protein